jgi:hypothetical protein
LVDLVGPHHLLVAISLLFLAARVCTAMEGLAGGADCGAGIARGGVVCVVCRSKILALKRGSRVAERARSDSSNSYPDKPVSRSLAAEFE